MAFSYPILLDLAERLAVIVGGGQVAVRKARGLLEGGCKAVRVVSVEFGEGLPPEVQRVNEAYRAEHLEGAFIVFAATDSPQVNAAVVRDALERGVLVSRADSDEQMSGSFSNMALHRDGELLVAVATGGSPALAAGVRDAIAARLDPAYAALAGALRELRRRILGAEGLTIQQRRTMFRDLAGDEAVRTMAESGAEGLWRWLLARHPALHAVDAGNEPGKARSERP